MLGRAKDTVVGSLGPLAIAGMISDASANTLMWTYPHNLDTAGAYLDTWKDVLLTRKNKINVLRLNFGSWDGRWESTARVAHNDNGLSLHPCFVTPFSTEIFAIQEGAF